MKNSLRYIAAAVLAATSFAASAAVTITEVAPWSSGNSPVGADWFELTNTGSSAVNITGWKVDDNSNSFASAVALNGIASIAAGQSVIFVEGNAATADAFKSNWFGAKAPANLTIRGGSVSARLLAGLNCNWRLGMRRCRAIRPTTKNFASACAWRLLPHLSISPGWQNCWLSICR